MEEKIITLNLRKEIIKTSRWRRSKRAIRFLRERLKKISKSEEILIDKKLNEKIWSGGNKPTKIRIKLIKVGEKTTKAELIE